MSGARSVEEDTAVYRAAELGSSPGARSNFSAELRYTLELGNVLHRAIDEVSAAQERTGKELAFDRALKRGREAIISMLHQACNELAPKDFTARPASEAGLEVAEVAEKTKKPSKKNLPALVPPRRREAVKKASVEIDDEKSAEVMSQWR